MLNFDRDANTDVKCQKALSNKLRSQEVYFWRFLSPLNEALEQAVQHVRPEAHEAHVLGRRVLALPVHDRALEHVTKLRLCSEEVGPNEVHHAPVLQQVVL